MIELHSDETIILTARRHWFALIGETFGVVLVSIGLIVGLSFIEAKLPQSVYDALGGSGLIGAEIIVTAGILLAALMSLAVIVTNYYLDVLVLTDKRIIDCEQHRIFVRDVATVPVENVIDIKVETAGILQTFFDFGTLYVQTAGMEKEVIVKGIAAPNAVRNAIMSSYRFTSHGQSAPTEPPPPTA